MWECLSLVICIVYFLFFAIIKLRNLHGRDIFSLNGVLGKITIKEYTCKKWLYYQSSHDFYGFDQLGFAELQQFTDQEEEAGAG